MELDTLYGHLSNLSQETAMILPEGYELEFVVPSGTPEVFKTLIDYIDKEISLVICGENEAGQAEAGSRASSQVANTVRVVRASELSEMLSKTLTQTLIRWIVDLNFGTDVAAPVLTREFRIEESPLTMPDVSLLIQSGYTPRKEWIERHFRVELEEKSGSEENAEENTTYNPQEDQDLFGSVFGDQGATAGGQAGGAAAAPVEEAAPEGAAAAPTPEQEAAAATDLEAAKSEVAAPEGAIPEESDSGMIQSAAPEDELAQVISELPEATPEEEESDTPEDDLASAIDELPEPAPEEEESTMTLEELLGEGEEEGEEEKPFGDEEITEDEAVDMARK
jgi:hypothetical protein